MFAFLFTTGEEYDNIRGERCLYFWGVTKNKRLTVGEYYGYDFCMYDRKK